MLFHKQNIIENEIVEALLLNQEAYLNICPNGGRKLFEKTFAAQLLHKAFLILCSSQGRQQSAA